MPTLFFYNLYELKPIFHLATLFAQREAKTRIRQRYWLKLAREKIRREQVGTVPTFLSVRANKFAKWKMGFNICHELREHLNYFWDSSPTLTWRNKRDVVSTSLCTKNFKITSVLVCCITTLELNV